MTEERFIGFYEILYVLHPNVNEAEENELREKMNKVITGAGGQVVREDYWGRRRLAYEVKKLNEGIYVWAYFRDLTAKSPKAIEEMIRTEARIIRHMVVSVPKAKILQDDRDAERAAAAAEAARVAEAERAKATAARAAQAAEVAAAAEAQAAATAAAAETTAEVAPAESDAAAVPVEAVQEVPASAEIEAPALAESEPATTEETPTEVKPPEEAPTEVRPEEIERPAGE